jgi:uncharacterized membrane protein YraQ (UPF0718 family)
MNNLNNTYHFIRTGAGILILILISLIVEYFAKSLHFVAYAYYLHTSCLHHSKQALHTLRQEQTSSLGKEN